MALAVAGLFLANPARAAVTVTDTNNVLTDTLSATSDTSTLSTGASSSIINASGVGTPFNGITSIVVDFQAGSQNVTFDSTNFAFTPAVTVNAVAGTASSDTVTIEGGNSVTLTGTGTYGGGTTINANSTLIVASSSALGTGAVTMVDGATLIGSGTFGLANAITFDSSNSGTIAATNGNTLTLSNLFVGSGSTVHFGSAGHTGTIAIGTGTYNADGGSILEVTAGTTLQNAGGLGALASAANVTRVDTGATLDVNDQSMAIANLDGSGTVTLGKLAATNLTLGGDNFSGVISGAGGVTINGTIVTFTGANTYTGGTTITNAGIFTLSGNGSVTGTIADSGQLIFNPTSAATYGNAISGTGTVQVIGGPVTLTGNSTFSGGTTVGMTDRPFSTGTLIVGSSTALGSGAVSVTNGSELIGNGAITLANVVNFINIGGGNPTLSATPGSTLTLNSVDVTDAANLTFGSTGHTGTVVVAGNVGTDPNTTGITVAFGTLQNGGGLGAITGVASSSTTVNTGATLNVNDQSMTIADLESSGTVTLGKLATTILTLGGGTVDGALSGAGQVTIKGATTFNGAKTYTGGTTINSGGTLTLGATGSIVGNVTADGSLVFANTGATTFAGVISGSNSGLVTANGPGVLTLTGNNTYRGNTVVGPGATLVLGSATAIGQGELTLSNGSELRAGTAAIDLHANPVIFASGTTNVTFSANTGVTFTTNSMDTTNATTVTFGSAGHTGTVIFGAGGGVADPAKSNVTVAFGTLQNGGLLGALTGASGATTTVNAGATLALNDKSMTVNDLEGSGAVTLGKLAATNLTLDAATFSGVISGAGGVTVNGAVNFSGADTYTGNTSITNGGTLEISGAGSVPGNITVGSGGELDFERTTPYTFAGVISGGGTVFHSGAVLTLTGNNTYANGTIIASTVVVGSNTALGTGIAELTSSSELRGGKGAITIGNRVAFLNSNTSGAIISATTGGTFTLNGILDLTNASDLTFGSAGNTGTVIISGGITGTSNSVAATVAFGTLRNGGPLGALTVNASSVTVNPGATLAANDLSITIADLEGSGAVTLGKSAVTNLTLDAATFNGVISGKGNVTIAGSVTLTGANTYTGGTTINGGSTLTISGAGSLVGTIANAGTVSFDRTGARLARRIQRSQSWSSS